MKQLPYFVIDSGTTITQETLSNSAGSIVVYSTQPNDIGAISWTLWNDWYKKHQEELLKQNINTNVNKLIDE